jgi:hypothetical protein
MMRDTRRPRVDLAVFVLAVVIAGWTWGAVAWRWEFAGFYLVAAFLLRLIGPNQNRLHSWILAGGAPVLIGMLYPQTWSTAAAAAHLTALAVGSLIPGFWLAELVRRHSA